MRDVESKRGFETTAVFRATERQRKEEAIAGRWKLATITVVSDDDGFEVRVLPQSTASTQEHVTSADMVTTEQNLVFDLVQP
jgi:hypothetical protein